MKYTFLEDVATADIAFEAYGKDEEELLVNSALAVFDASADLNKIAGNVKKEVELEASSLHDLLYDLLEEIIFLKDADYIVFNKIELKLTKTKEVYHVFADLWGDSIDPEKHDLRNDIKAVTMHQYKVEKTDEGWKAFVILDV